jgi:hypothetical protein
MAENNQLTSVSVQNGNNSFAYIDQIISLRIFKTIEGLMKDLNVKSIVLLIGLLGADSLKKLVKSCIETSLNKLQDTNFRFLFFNIMNFFKTKQKLIVEKKINKLILKYTPKNIFWEGLDKIMKTDKDTVKFNVVSSKIEQISKIEYNLHQIINNLTIKNLDWNCSFIDNINLIYKCIGNEKKIDKGSYESFVFDYNKTLFENLPFKDFIEDYKKSNMYKSSVNFNTQHFIIIINNNYKKYNRNLNLIRQELAGILFAGRSNILQFSVDKSFTLFGLNFPVGTYMKLNSYYNWSNIRDADKVKEWVDNQINSTETNENETSFNLCITSSNLQLNLLECWTKFVDSFQKNVSNSDEGNKIKIYDIKMLITETTIDIPNPEYKGNEESGKEDGNKNKIPKFLKKTKINKEISETLINEIYKDFSTLYLKEQDSFFLNSTLDRFKNKKDIYINLGLPYKFGALLYGKPGTGKSSCINAISSYLKKDIYYLDLTTVKTNDDLKLLFNHINKEKNENGIIVIEDIDAMTNVVHKRELQYSNNGELTLECLLNLLQGTLTHDGTTFLITTNHIEKLDPAFYRDGRFDIKIELTPCDHFQMNTIYNKFFERNIPQNLLQKIPELEITPATFIQKLLLYILTPDLSDSDILKDILNKIN